MVVTAVVVGLTIGATALGGLINGETPSFDTWDPTCAA